MYAYGKTASLTINSMANEPGYPPPLSQEQSDYILLEIKNWSILNGLAVRPPESFIPKSTDPSGSLAVTAPVTLFPSIFPRQCFEEARAIQKAYNELYAAIARNEDWLSHVVNEYASWSSPHVIGACIPFQARLSYAQQRKRIC